MDTVELLDNITLACIAANLVHWAWRATPALPRCGDFPFFPMRGARAAYVVAVACMVATIVAATLSLAHVLSHPWSSRTNTVCLAVMQLVIIVNRHALRRVAEARPA